MQAISRGKRSTKRQLQRLGAPEAAWEGICIMSILAYIMHGSSQNFMELVKGTKGGLPLPFLPKTYTSRLSGTKEACPVFLWELSGEDALQLVADALTRLFYRLTMSKFGSYRRILVSMADTQPRFPVGFELADRYFCRAKQTFTTTSGAAGMIFWHPLNRHRTMSICFAKRRAMKSAGATTFAVVACLSSVTKPPISKMFCNSAGQ